MMRPLLRSTVVLLLFLFALPAMGVTVTGTVRDASGTNRLAGMTVQAYTETGLLTATGTTDLSGLYVINVPAGVSYRFLAFDPNGQFATSFAGNADSYESSPLIQITGQRTIDFNLTPGAFISGHVTSGPSLPRPGMTVAAYNQSGTRRGFTKTNDNGFFFLVVPPGSYRLVAFDETGTWSTVFHSGVTSFEDASTVTLATAGQTATVSFITTPAARIRGKVVDAVAGVPLRAIVVYAYTTDGALVATAATDTLGNYRLFVPPGAYRIVAADPARTFANEPLGGTASFEASQPISVTSGESRDGVNLAMSRGGVVQGRVLGPDGAPLGGILVAAYNPDGTRQTLATTDIEGRYVFAVKAGDVIIGASDPSLNHAPQFHLRSATFRDATELAVAVGQTWDGVDFTLVAAGRLQGVVRGSNGVPVGGVTVAAYDAAGALVASNVSGADGIYRLAVPPGAYRLAAFDTALLYAAAFAGAGSYEASLPVPVTAGQQVQTDFVVHAGVRVRGTVTARSGADLNGIEITALDSAGNNVGGAFSSDGAFNIVLLPGSYRFVAEDASGEYRTVYYRDAGSLATATVVVVTGGQLPSPLQFVLDEATRRRAARH